MEDEAYILDFLATGRPDDTRNRGPLAYAVGTKEFALFALVPREGVALTPGDKVYIGKEVEDRTQIERVRERVTYDQLTHVAQSELTTVLEDLVKQDEARFVEFFNNCGPISVRMHVLEVLPGVGKRLMQHILEERRKQPFTSFEDIHERVSGMHDPVKAIVGRIDEELSDPEIKYRLFTRPPKVDHGGPGGHGGHRGGGHRGGGHRGGGGGGHRGGYRR